MKKSNEQAIAAVSTETLKKCGKNSRINHTSSVNFGHVEEHSTWMNLLEYIYYNTYLNTQKKKE